MLKNRLSVQPVFLYFFDSPKEKWLIELLSILLVKFYAMLVLVRGDPQGWSNM
jgi:hypothetical protein